MIELEYASNEVIEEKIKSKESFSLIGISSGKMIKTCKLLERAIENNLMSCRIVTKNRTIISGLFFWTGIGATALVSQVAHTVATYDPDWKILKNFAKNKIEVRYCRKLK
jgi:hypothetical protein